MFLLRQIITQLLLDILKNNSKIIHLIGKSINISPLNLILVSWVRSTTDVESLDSKLKVKSDPKK